MTVRPDPPPAVPGLSAAQHKAALWSDTTLSVHGVIMAERVPDLAARLAAADVADFDCLLPGALAPQQQRTAPYLVRLRPASVFTDWLLFKACTDVGDWGVLVRGEASFIAMRSHLRSLLKAQLPDGQTIALPWMDPPILSALLPLFDPAGLATFFGPVESLVIAGSAQWTTARLQLGRLSLTSTPLLRAG